MSQYLLSDVKRPKSSESVETSALPWWLYLIVITGALLLAAGGIIALIHPALLVPPGEEINGAVRIYAGYMVSRNLAIAVMLLGALSLRARGALSTLMVLVAFIQFLDAGINCFEGRWTLVPGVAVIGIAFLFGATRTAAHPLWEIGSSKRR
jgi:hypothetical protein